MNSSQQHPRSLRHYVARSLAKGLFLVAVIFAGGGAYALGGGFDIPPRATDEQMMDIRPHAEGSPAALTDSADCWTGEAPADMAGVVPGHVVVTVDGETRKAGARMVSKALAQLFDGEDHGLTVHGFCR